MTSDPLVGLACACGHSWRFRAAFRPRRSWRFTVDRDDWAVLLGLLGLSSALIALWLLCLIALWLLW